MKLEQKSKIHAVLPTASMADIAFLLIIFFMLTTSSAVDKANVNLPESVVRIEIQDNAAVVSIDGQGIVRFSDGYENSTEVNSMDELSSRIEGALRFDPDKQFILKVDKNVKYAEFDAVYEQLRNQQALNINLLTEQEIVG